MGIKIHYLEILEDRGSKVLCKCDCGNIKELHKYLVFRETYPTKSCGCYRKQCGQDKVRNLSLSKFRMKPTGSELIIHDLWNQIVIKARQRKISLSISPIDLENQFKNQNGKCVFTGLSLTLPETATERRKCKHTASLDRIDSSKGYEVGNIQWVHKRINLMKLNSTDEEFIQWCKLVANHSH